MLAQTTRLTLDGTHSNIGSRCASEAQLFRVKAHHIGGKQRRGREFVHSHTDGSGTPVLGQGTTTIDS